MLSCSWTNPTPWDSPREEPEERLLERLHGLAAQLDPGLTTIFNLHCPPHGTTLDRAPQLTADLKVVLDGGEPRIVLGRLDGGAHPDRGGAARAVAARAHP